MNKEDLIKKYESLEGVWDANGAEIARQCFLRDLEQLNEIDTKKVTVPQYVADLIEGARSYEWDLDYLFDHIDELPGDSEISTWFYTLGNVDVLARAWLDGFEIEKEKRYYVRLKGVDENYNYFSCIKHLDAWCLTELKTDKKFRMTHTRKQLEDADFGWVFDCPGIEIEEVEE